MQAAAGDVAGPKAADVGLGAAVKDELCSGVDGAWVTLGLQAVTAKSPIKTIAVRALTCPPRLLGRRKLADEPVAVGRWPVRL
jgi:hypothetical protein